MGGAALLFALASLGLPGLGNFAAEFLILFGTFRAAPIFAVAASLGLIASTIYALSLFQRIFQGPKSAEAPFRDLGPREIGVLAALAVVIIWLGLYPQPVLDTSRAAVAGIQSAAAPGRTMGIVSANPASPAAGPKGSPHVTDEPRGRTGPEEGGQR
jgi:NADH-quinone oxidoreductase subunit M